MKNLCSCGELKDIRANRCRNCANKIRSKKMSGRKNPNFQGRAQTPRIRKKMKQIAKKRFNKYKRYLNYIDGRSTRPKFCSVCGKEMCRRAAKKCLSCHKAYLKTLKGEKNSNWKGGISRLPYSFDFNAALKELIRKRDQYKCQKCGAPQEEFTQKLPVHHIDYNKENINPDNLLTLCRKCNGEVNFNREYWMDYLLARVSAVKNNS